MKQIKLHKVILNTDLNQCKANKILKIKYYTFYMNKAKTKSMLTK